MGKIYYAVIPINLYNKHIIIIPKYVFFYRRKIIYDFLDSENLYNKLDKLRQDKGLSIYAISKKAGVSCSSIYKWRDRKSSPSLYLIESLCEVLEINIINLFIKNEDLAFLSYEEKELFVIWKSLRKEHKIIFMDLAKSLLPENQKKE